MFPPRYGRGPFSIGSRTASVGFFPGQLHVGGGQTCGTGILPVALCGIGILPCCMGWKGPPNADFRVGDPKPMPRWHDAHMQLPWGSFVITCRGGETRVFWSSPLRRIRLC